jgi:hypothetical protein
MSCQLVSDWLDAAVVVLAPAVGCVCSGIKLPCMIFMINAVLGTLPDADQSTVFWAANLLQGWRFMVHSDPTASTATTLTVGGMVEALRGSCLAAYVSHVTYVTVNEHLSGARPVADWSLLQQVSEEGLLLVCVHA